MSESWQPDESEIWQTRPSESSHPSFPFADHSVDPFWQSGLPSQPIPAPPPPPLTASAVNQDDRRTEPIIGATFGMGIGVIIGAIMSTVVIVGLIGYLLVNNGLAFGNHTPENTAINSTPVTGGGTQGGGGNSAGGSSNQGGAGGVVPGATATTGVTATPGLTPVNTGTPGASMTATTVATTATAIPPTATNTPTPLPLAVTATTQDHQSVTITVQTKDSASLTIKVTFCDGSISTLSGTAVAGAYNTVITSGIPKCSGKSPDTVTVTGHLAGYQDASVTTTTTQVG